MYVKCSTHLIEKKTLSLRYNQRSELVDYLPTLQGSNYRMDNLEIPMGYYTTV